jgi:hypothetical protein
LKNGKKRDRQKNSACPFSPLFFFLESKFINFDLSRTLIIQQKEKKGQKLTFLTNNFSDRLYIKA